jgi:hypothetical protein
MRRIISVLAVALVMAVMMVVMAIPAFAKPQFGPPGTPGHPTCTIAAPVSPAIEPDPVRGQGFCRVAPTFGILPEPPPRR